MKHTRLPCDQYVNCPICGKTCDIDEMQGYNTVLRVQGTCHVFNCYNPLATNPLHYYSHIVEKDKPEFIAYQEFSIDLGTQSVLFGINHIQQKSNIKTSKNMEPLELDFIIVPDFPSLEHLKKKIRTAIVFS